MILLRRKETITYASSRKYEQLRTNQKTMEVGSLEREFLFHFSPRFGESIYLTN